MENQDLDMYRNIAAFENELKEMKALGDVPPGTSNRFEAMEAIVARMKNLVKEVRAHGSFFFFFFPPSLSQLSISILIKNRNKFFFNVFLTF